MITTSPPQPSSGTQNKDTDTRQFQRDISLNTPQSQPCSEEGKIHSIT
jgi:hypothetical protein